MVPLYKFHDPVKSSKVYQLKKRIYGLKKSLQVWYQRLSNCLFEDRFRKSESDNSIFTIHMGNGIVAILIYVGDIIITGNNMFEVEETKHLFNQLWTSKI